MARIDVDYLSLFTGAGGLDLGLEAAGFRLIAAIENDLNARQSIAVNRPNWPLIENGDIEAVDPLTLRHSLGLRRGELPLLAGGPPCQPFSKAAQWTPTGARGLKDARAGCLHSMVAIWIEFQPKVVLIENVPGFLTGRRSAIDFLSRSLASSRRRGNAEYTFHHAVFDAADFGVPQHRSRAITIATRGDVSFSMPSPTHQGKFIRSWDALADLNVRDATVATGKWAELLPSIPEGWNYQWHSSIGGGAELFGPRTKFWSFLLKLAKNRPSWTIPAQPGPATGPFHWDNRPLAIQERLRLQTFPADWMLVGGARAQVRQVGNATPPLLAEVFGRAIAKQIFGASFSDTPRFGITRRTSVPRRTRPKPVSARYSALIGKYSRHPGTGKGPAARLASN